MTRPFRACKRDDGMGKRAYSSKGLAKRFIRRGGISHRRREASIYRCAFCGWWHIGHKLPKEDPA